MNNNDKFNELRQKHHLFVYSDYTIENTVDGLTVTYSFIADGICEFNPQIRVPVSYSVNSPSASVFRDIVFSLGMVELVSYWKAACQPLVRVDCGVLTDEEILWWKKLYYGGLGEFFYINGINTDFDSFMTIECSAIGNTKNDSSFISSGCCLVPVGGGKDSDVTLELLTDMHETIRPFTVNRQKARTDAISAAGCSQNSAVTAFRTIDKNLLELNRRGFLNGHTPFSAIVAFLGYLCAYLIGADYIVLSNEGSANESNIEGTNINHQYSKSFEFERDFDNYAAKRFALPVRYFSLLRPFTELQIAARFAKAEKYLNIFRSCNAGSKSNVWCCECPKCLFVFCILSPFVERKKLIEIFGEDLLNKESLRESFDGLVGFSSVKPFECVGTKTEVRLALSLTVKRLNEREEKLPLLLDYFSSNVDIGAVAADTQPLTQFCSEHAIPDKFMPAVMEMYRYVSTNA